MRDSYPRPQNPAYVDRVLSGEGRFMRRSEVGQSESWPEGQPEGRYGAWGRASQAPTGRPWVSVRPEEWPEGVQSDDDTETRPWHTFLIEMLIGVLPGMAVQ